MTPVEEMVTWKVEVTGRDGATKEKSTHSTFKGTLIAKEELRKMRPTTCQDFRRRLKSNAQFWSSATARAPLERSRESFVCAFRRFFAHPKKPMRP
jgi:hypothetical protein